MQKFLISFFVVGLAVVFLCWMSLFPTISPDDVELTNYVEIIPSTEQSSANQGDQLILTIFLDNKASKPLVNEYKDYFYTVYIYNPPAYRYLSYEFPDNISPNEIHIGGDSRTAREANNNLIERANVSLLNENNQFDTDGFMYSGDKFPFFISYNFAENPKKEQSDNNFYVIFSFHEKRFGKDVSWSKVYLVEKSK